MSVTQSVLATSLIAGIVANAVGTAAAAGATLTPKQLVEKCRSDSKAWEECYSAAVEDEQFASNETSFRVCALGGGNFAYCFPDYDLPASAFPSNDDSGSTPSLELLRPRSLWTETPIDLLHEF